MEAVGPEQTAASAVAPARAAGRGLLEVRDLHMSFAGPDGRRVHAVRGVDFDVRAGERVALVGESGCGKTTSILAVMGLLPPSAKVRGSIRVAGLGPGAADGRHAAACLLVSPEAAPTA